MRKAVRLRTLATEEEADIRRLAASRKESDRLVQRALGSTSLLTDQSGALTYQARYQPFGKERWTSGEAQTDFGFTGQRAAGFGLVDYGARFYSPSLGRFAQADSIVPGPGNSQAWDRYAYVYNNPLRYVDPSGHVPCMDDGYCPERMYSLDAHLAYYGVFTAGNWGKNDTTNRDQYAVLFAVQAVGAKFAEVLGGSWADAFRRVFDKGVEIYGGNDRKGLTSECSGIGSGACTSSGKLINVQSMGGAAPNRPAHIAAQLNINNIVHELGHAFANLFISFKGGRQERAPGSPYDFFGSGAGNPYKNLAGYHPAPGGASRMWVQNPTYTGNETFAHMFLGWTFNKWGSDKMGYARHEFMLGYMPTQVNLAAGR